MSDSADTQLVIDIARSWVDELAPSELPIYDMTAEEYRHDPSRVLKAARPKDPMLGFGGAADVTMLTPFVLPVAAQLVQFLAGELQKATKDASAELIRGKIKALFSRLQPGAQPAPAEKVPLTPAQLARMRQIMLQEAERMHWSKDRAQLFANSVLGRLSIDTR